MEALARSTYDMLGMRLSERQLRAFRTYAEELSTWNARVNLTAITEPKAVEMRHFLDALTCLLVISPAPGLRVIDVGTGAGFPGLPLHIAYPQTRLTLMDSTGKKLAFLDA